MWPKEIDNLYQDVQNYYHFIDTVHIALEVEK